MTPRTRALASLVAATWLVGCQPASTVDATNTQADVLPATESHVDFGDYVVYFNAVTTDHLTQDIASQYGIVRSRDRVLLNVAIHRKVGGGSTEAVTGTVSASATNLNGQLRNMSLREIREEKAIYYVGELGVTDGEVLIYTVDALPVGTNRTLNLRFQKQYFAAQ
jgi:hypothetical protein